MKINPERFGRGLKRIRTLRRMTQSRLAKKSGLTVNYISLLENGERTVSMDAVNSLSKAFDVPAQFMTFIGGTKPKKQFAELTKSTESAIWAALEADQEAREERIAG